MKWLIGTLVVFVLLVSAIVVDGHYTRLARTEALQEALERDVTSDLARLDFDARGPQLDSISTHYRFYRSRTFYDPVGNSTDMRCKRPIAFTITMGRPTSLLRRFLFGDPMNGEPQIESTGYVLGRVFEDRTFEMPTRPGRRLNPTPAPDCP